jgi:hypothetical protein
VAAVQYGQTNQLKEDSDIGRKGRYLKKVQVGWNMWGGHLPVIYCDELSIKKLLNKCALCHQMMERHNNQPKVGNSNG